MADPECFDADLDPTFQDDAHPDPKFFLAKQIKIIFYHIFTFSFSLIFQNLSCVIFSLTMREEEQGVRDKV